MAQGFSATYAKLNIAGQVCQLGARPGSDHSCRKEGVGKSWRWDGEAGVIPEEGGQQRGLPCQHLGMGRKGWWRDPHKCCCHKTWGATVGGAVTSASVHWHLYFCARFWRRGKRNDLFASCKIQPWFIGGVIIYLPLLHILKTCIRLHLGVSAACRQYSGRTSSSLLYKLILENRNGL